MSKEQDEGPCSPPPTPRPSLHRLPRPHRKLPGTQELEIQPGPGPTHPPDSFLSQMGRLGQGVNGNSCPRESEAGFNHAWHVPKPPSSSPRGHILASSAPPFPSLGEGGSWGAGGETDYNCRRGSHSIQASSTSLLPSWAAALSQ